MHVSIGKENKKLHRHAPDPIQHYIGPKKPSYKELVKPVKKHKKKTPRKKSYPYHEPKVERLHGHKKEKHKKKRRSLPPKMSRQKPSQYTEETEPYADRFLTAFPNGVGDIDF